MKTLSIYSKSDTIGVLGSALCLIHCFVTPLLFVAHTNTIIHNWSMPLWWKWVDIIFLVISLYAVYHSANRTSSTWIKYALWISWGVLSFSILNEKIGLVHIPEIAIYSVASFLILIHLYNYKYCQCTTNCQCNTPKRGTE